VIKVMWFLKKADHLTLAEFRDWWLNVHAPQVRDTQAPHLARYTVNVRKDTDELPGKPKTESDWDGIAEQWFATEADFRAIYGRAVSPTRGDTLAHTSKLERIIVSEHEFAISTADQATHG
jgi:hypothetical protein